MPSVPTGWTTTTSAGSSGSTGGCAGRCSLRASAEARLRIDMAGLAFITGASSGIGQALAMRYYQAGWQLALVARRAADIQRWAQEQGLETQRYAVYAADVADTDSIVAAGLACT